MSVLRRAPRELYRVYREEEYMSGGGVDPLAVEQAGPRRSLAIVPAGMLIALVAALAWVLASTGHAPVPSPRRRFVSRLLAATRVSSSRASEAPAVAQAADASRSRGSLAGARPRSVRPRAPRAAGHARAHPASQASPAPPPATVQHASPRELAAGAVRVTAATRDAGLHAASPSGSEFGFER